MANRYEYVQPGSEHGGTELRRLGWKMRGGCSACDTAEHWDLKRDDAWLDFMVGPDVGGSWCVFAGCVSHDGGSEPYPLNAQEAYAVMCRLRELNNWKKADLDERFGWLPVYRSNGTRSVDDGER